MEIVINTFLQISGKPKENVQRALDVIRGQLEKDRRCKILECEILEPELDDLQILFSGLLELKIEFCAVKDVLAFVYDYLPMSIEVEQPNKLEIEIGDFNSILNDISSKTMNLTNENRRLKTFVHKLNKRSEE